MHPFSFKIYAITPKKVHRLQASSHVHVEFYVHGSRSLSKDLFFIIGRSNKAGICGFVSKYTNLSIQNFNQSIDYDNIILLASRKHIYFIAYVQFFFLIMVFESLYYYDFLQICNSNKSGLFSRNQYSDILLMQIFFTCSWKSYCYYFNILSKNYTNTF